MPLRACALILILLMTVVAPITSMVIGQAAPLSADITALVCWVNLNSHCPIEHAACASKVQSETKRTSEIVRVIKAPIAHYVSCTRLSGEQRKGQTGSQAGAARGHMRLS